jgi:hypothetical protein
VFVVAVTTKTESLNGFPIALQNYLQKDLVASSTKCEHTRILGALVEHPQGNLEEIQQENPAEHPRGTCRPSGP